tara:strand:+ start:1082 stop:1327 length:246 start_codon:yes stop_codon:yes gene_type:complete
MKIGKEPTVNINKSYIQQAFKGAKVQLSKEAETHLIHHLRKYISMVALRCNRYNIKRLTTDPKLLGYALGDINSKGEANAR